MPSDCKFKSLHLHHISETNYTAFLRFRARKFKVKIVDAFVNFDYDEKHSYLYNSNLSDIHLECCDLSCAELSNADLTNSKLIEANLYRADLTGANLSEANLIDTDLTSANLNSAGLFNSNLLDAYLYGVNICGADFYYMLEVFQWLIFATLFMMIVQNFLRILK